MYNLFAVLANTCFVYIAFKSLAGYCISTEEAIPRSNNRGLIIIKKILLSFAIAMSSYCSYAQYLPLTAGSGNPLTGPLDINATAHSEISTSNGDFLSIEAFNSSNTIKKPLALAPWGGNVGIGVTSPETALVVNKSGVVPSLGLFATQSSLFLNNSSSGVNRLMINTSGSGTSEIDFGNSTTLDAGSFNYDHANNKLITRVNSAPVMTILSSGNVAIGANDPLGYKLAVNGSAIATSMTVKLYGSWPDFVFKRNYKLPNLSDVKSYIEQNQYLPDMPSEQEVKDKGINLGEIVKVQTMKIEELTLYAIQLKEENKRLKYNQQKNNDEQEARIAALERALSKITVSK